MPYMHMDIKEKAQIPYDGNCQTGERVVGDEMTEIFHALEFSGAKLEVFPYICK
jgi:hypothetical protein